MVHANSTNVLQFPTQPGITAEKLGLYTLVMLDQYGAVPSGIAGQFIGNDLAEIYFRDIGITDVEIPFFKLTSRGRKGAKSAYLELRQDPAWENWFTEDTFEHKHKWPNQKFLMTHQRFKRELRSLEIEDLLEVYRLDISADTFKKSF